MLVSSHIYKSDVFELGLPSGMRKKNWVGPLNDMKRGFSISDGSMKILTLTTWKSRTYVYTHFYRDEPEHRSTNINS